jgi:tRNA pseudouridine55 synthase
MKVELDGVLPVLKPAGMTSHDVVARVRRLLRTRKIGHTGTLDPDVTGVLPLCLGRATRAVEWLQEMPKSYEAVMKIGIATDTDDESGTVVETAENVRVTEQEVARALQSFVGDIEQIPPMVSAVKIGGRRLYEWAREGVEVERQPRKVHIYELNVLDMRLDEPYPEIRFFVRCSKGTYIRTLCADIGRALGYPAVMSSLVRTSSGPFHLRQCLSLERIAELQEHGTIAAALTPVDEALSHFPKAEVPAAYAAKAACGAKLPLRALLGRMPEGTGLFRLYSAEGEFIGVFRLDEKRGEVAAVKVFAT